MRKNISFANSTNEITVLQNGFTWLNLKFHGQTAVFEQQRKESDEKTERRGFEKTEGREREA